MWWLRTCDLETVAGSLAFAMLQPAMRTVAKAGIYYHTMLARFEPQITPCLKHSSISWSDLCSLNFVLWMWYKYKAFWVSSVWRLIISRIVPCGLQRVSAAVFGQTVITGFTAACGICRSKSSQRWGSTEPFLHRLFWWRAVLSWIATCNWVIASPLEFSFHVYLLGFLKQRLLNKCVLPLCCAARARTLCSTRTHWAQPRTLWVLLLPALNRAGSPLSSHRTSQPGFGCGQNSLATLLGPPH